VLVGNLPVYDLRDRYKGYKPRNALDVKTISIHHWAGLALPEEATVAQEIAAMDAIDRQHKGQDWPAYAYHYTAFRSGRVYKTGDEADWRYVAAGGNHETVAIALPGDFTASPPFERHLQTVAGLVAEIQFEYGPDHPLTVVPHKFYGGTACPGNTWPTWKDAVSVALGNKEEASPFDQRQQDADLIAGAAGFQGFDPRVLLALCIAEAEPESGRLINPTKRRPEDPADDLSYWPDVSGGCCQQTVRWSAEYIQDFGRVYKEYPGPEYTQAVLEKYYDPQYALQVAAMKLAGFLIKHPDPVDALCLYNKNSEDPATNPHRNRYAESYGRAVTLWELLGR